MGLFKRNRQATERVQDLKNRVESLRKVDNDHRALTLDDFLFGDDAVSARGEPRYVQSQPAPQTEHVPPEHVPAEHDLEAELQRFLEHRSEDEPAVAIEVDLAVDLAPQEPARPLPPLPTSIDEFPPLPPRVSPAAPSAPPRLSADDEAALIAELQRYLNTDDDVVAEDETEPTTTLSAAVEDEIAWLAGVPEFPADNDNEIIPADDSPVSDTVGSAPSTVEVEGRTYEEPKPRHWPSTPRQEPAGDASANAGSSPAPKRVTDWEPL